MIEWAKADVGPRLKHVCIPVKKQTLPFEAVFNALKEFKTKKIESDQRDPFWPVVYHIDIAYAVWYEVD
jgi:hypothetical protein